MAGTCGYGEGLSGPINAGNFLTSCKVNWLASQEGLCSMEKVSKYKERNVVQKNWPRQNTICNFQTIDQNNFVSISCPKERTVRKNNRNVVVMWLATYKFNSQEVQ